MFGVWIIHKQPCKWQCLGSVLQAYSGQKPSMGALQHTTAAEIIGRLLGNIGAYFVWVNSIKATWYASICVEAKWSEEVAGVGLPLCHIVVLTLLLFMHCQGEDHFMLPFTHHLLPSTPLPSHWRMTPPPQILRYALCCLLWSSRELNATSVVAFFYHCVAFCAAYEANSILQWKLQAIPTASTGEAEEGELLWCVWSVQIISLSLSPSR